MSSRFNLIERDFVGTTAPRERHCTFRRCLWAIPTLRLLHSVGQSVDKCLRTLSIPEQCD
jgi:hypothetical protein